MPTHYLDLRPKFEITVRPEDELKVTVDDDISFCFSYAEVRAVSLILHGLDGSSCTNPTKEAVGYVMTLTAWSFGKTKACVDAVRVVNLA